jgi:hypothetical protein
MKRLTVLLLAVALVGGIFATGASGDQKTPAAERYRDCRALGGSLLACCAAVGGELNTVIIDGKEVTVCTIVSTPKLSTSAGAAAKNAEQPKAAQPGAETSSVASGGKSKAAGYGVVSLRDPAEEEEEEEEEEIISVADGTTCGGG